MNNRISCIKLEKLEDIKNIDLNKYVIGTAFVCVEKYMDFLGYKYENDVLFNIIKVKPGCIVLGINVNDINSIKFKLANSILYKNTLLYYIKDEKEYIGVYRGDYEDIQFVHIESNGRFGSICDINNNNLFYTVNVLDDYQYEKLCEERRIKEGLERVLNTIDTIDFKRVIQKFYGYDIDYILDFMFKNFPTLKYKVDYDIKGSNESSFVVLIDKETKNKGKIDAFDFNGSKDDANWTVDKPIYIDNEGPIFREYNKKLRSTFFDDTKYEPIIKSMSERYPKLKYKSDYEIIFSEGKYYVIPIDDIFVFADTKESMIIHIVDVSRYETVATPEENEPVDEDAVVKKNKEYMEKMCKSIITEPSHCGILKEKVYPVRLGIDVNGNRYEPDKNSISKADCTHTYPYNSKFLDEMRANLDNSVTQYLHDNCADEPRSCFEDKCVAKTPDNFMDNCAEIPNYNLLGTTSVIDNMKSREPIICNPKDLEKYSPVGRLVSGKEYREMICRIVEV